MPILVWAIHLILHIYKSISIVTKSYHILPFLKDRHFKICIGRITCSTKEHSKAYMKGFQEVHRKHRQCFGAFVMPRCHTNLLWFKTHLFHLQSHPGRQAHHDSNACAHATHIDDLDGVPSCYWLRFSQTLDVVPFSRINQQKEDRFLFPSLSAF